MQFTPSAYYATARKAVAGQSELSLSYAPRRRGYLELSGGVLSADYNGESGESRLINTVASSFFGRNDVKLYEKRFLSFQNKIELANSLLLSTSLSWQRRQMLENHIHRSWFKKEAESNIPDSRAFYPMPWNIHQLIITGCTEERKYMKNPNALPLHCVMTVLSR